MIVKHLETRNQDYNNLTLDGLSVKAKLQGAAASGAASVDFSKSIIKVILYRDGKQPFVICQDNLLLLGLASTLNTLDQYSFSTTQSNGIKLANQQYQVSFTIKFGCHINLKGTDKLFVEIQNIDGLFTDASLTQNSYLDIKPHKSVGVERCVNKIISKTVQANEQSNQYSFGDFITRLVVMNLDKTDFQNNVIATLAFNSDRLNEVYTYEDLIASKTAGYASQLIPTNPDLSLAMQEDQSFVLIGFGSQFDAVLLDINFNNQNVVASKNYIIAWQASTDWETLEKAVSIDSKHQKEAAAKISSSVNDKK